MNPKSPPFSLSIAVNQFRQMATYSVDKLVLKIALVFIVF